MASMMHLLKDVELPYFAKVRCEFDRTEVLDVEATVRAELHQPEIVNMVKPGMKIAIGIGSRGLAELPLITRILVEELRALEAEPFIVPAMGSHGGATAEGQKAVLAHLGITEETVGCPIRATMETVALGRVEIPEIGKSCETYLDKNAYMADGICMIARVKVHSSFKDVIESGLCKMFVIGLGKQKGAQTYHTVANGRMGRVVENVARVNLPKSKVLFALGTVENAYDRICELKAVPRDQIIEKDKAMLRVAKQRIGKLPFDQMDVLIVEKMGKEISGECMDPNITGRRATGRFEGGPAVTRLGVLQLTDTSDGNVVGIGAADAVTEELYRRIDMNISYSNALTTGGLYNVKLPMVLGSDFEVIAACHRSTKVTDSARSRIVLIQDTGHLDCFWCSEAFEKELKTYPNITRLTEYAPLPFNERGKLLIDWD